MIISFGNQLALDIFEDFKSKESRSFPQELQRLARRKLIYLNSAYSLLDLKIPPGNRLEALKGDKKGYYSIRINDQWRITFKWQNGMASNVKIVDYHK